MNGPRHAESYPDRKLDCESEMSDKIMEALFEAEAAGWDRVEAAKAMVEAAKFVYMGESGTDPNE